VTLETKWSCAILVAILVAAMIAILVIAPSLLAMDTVRRVAEFLGGLR